MWTPCTRSIPWYPPTVITDELLINIRVALVRWQRKTSVDPFLLNLSRSLPGKRIPLTQPGLFYTQPVVSLLFTVLVLLSSIYRRLSKFGGLGTRFQPAFFSTNSK
jgi:hypothetical protein